MPIYLDNAAMSFPKPESVYQVLDRFARTSLGNPGRGGHKFARESEAVIRDCRHELNQLFHGESPDRFVLTLNCTDSLNIAMKGVIEPGDHVITTDLEHNSVSRPLVAMAAKNAITLSRVKADSGGTIDPDELKKLITSKTKLMVVTHASNVLGTVQPIELIGNIARECGALLLVDAAQTAGVLPIDVQAMNIDLLALPGHKALFGPSGTGALYVGPRAHVRPWREGGTGGDSKNPVQPEELPFALEGGTSNALGAAGLCEGIRFIQKTGIATIHEKEIALSRYLAEQIEEMNHFRIQGHSDWNRRVSTLSLSLKSPDVMNVSDLAAVLDASFEIAIRPGLHCAPYIHKSQGSFPDGTVRVSPGFFNTQTHMDRFVTAIKEIFIS